MVDFTKSATDHLQSLRQSVEKIIADATIRIRDAATTVGETIKQSADGAWKSAESTASQAAKSVSSSTAAAGHQLHATGEAVEQGLERMVEDTTTLIRRYPLPAMIAGVGLALILARSLSNRR